MDGVFNTAAFFGGMKAAGAFRKLKQKTEGKKLPPIPPIPPEYPSIDPLKFDLGKVFAELKEIEGDLKLLDPNLDQNEDTWLSDPKNDIRMVNK